MISDRQIYFVKDVIENNSSTRRSATRDRRSAPDVGRLKAPSIRTSLVMPVERNEHGTGDVQFFCSFVEFFKIDHTI